MKEKSGQQDKDAKEGSNLQVAGPAGEITAGILLDLKYCFLVGYVSFVQIIIYIYSQIGNSR